MRLDRRICVIALTCLALAMVGVGCSDERADTAVSIEEFKKLAQSDAFSSSGPDTPEPEWEAYRKDGGIFVRQHKHSPAPNAKPPFDGHTHIYPGNVRRRRISDGWLRGWDNGEFGGGLEWYSLDGTPGYKLSNENVRDFVELEGQMYVLTGFSMGMDTDMDNSEFRKLVSDKVRKLVRNDDTGRWVAKQFVTLPGTPGGFFIDDRGALIIATSAGLVEVWPDARTKLLVPWRRWGTLRPDVTLIGSDGRLCFNSFVMAEGGDTAYIGMEQAVIEITSLQTKPKMRYFIRNIPLSD